MKNPLLVFCTECADNTLAVNDQNLCQNCTNRIDLQYQDYLNNSLD